MFLLPHSLDTWEPRVNLLSAQPLSQDCYDRVHARGSTARCAPELEAGTGTRSSRRRTVDLKNAVKEFLPKHVKETHSETEINFLAR